MRSLGRIGTRAVELGLATEKQVMEAHKFRQIARIENGLDIGLDEALLWQGAVTFEQLESLRRELKGSADHAQDRYGKLQFGMLALTMGFIGADELRAALGEQALDDRDEKPHRLVGEILFRKGILDSKQVKTLVDMLVDGGLGGASGRQEKPDARPDARGRITVEGFEM